METSLHRDLKVRYAGDDARTEIRVGNYRIDAIVGDQLIEIQLSSLSAIRDKIRALVEQHDVLVVKPIIASKLLVKRKKKNGKVADRRRSPKKCKLIDAFDELVYFTRAFPHPNLQVEIVLVDVEEWRFPGHGRRRRHRAGDFEVEDQKLVEIHEHRRLTKSGDLWQLLPDIKLPSPFHTGHLAKAVGIERWIAQRITYVLRETGAVRRVGKQGNANLYSIPRAKAA